MTKFLTVFILLPLFCVGQKQGNIWYFGDHAGLDFSNGTPVALTNGATPFNNTFCQSEGTAVISDSAGSLLFYTNGEQIWNKNHQIMFDSLLGNNSSTQSALIIPQPGSSRYFYVFTTDDFCNDTLKDGLRYSIVDICLKGGLGDVMTNQKNIKLLDTIAEKLTAVRHLNGADYWVITHKYFSDAFYAFKLTSSGVTDTVVSHVGSVHPPNVGLGAAIGQLKASPNGQKLAIVTGNGASIAEYFDFDKNTGVVSNAVSVQTNSVYNYYGVSFSPDNSKLYIACWLNDYGIHQFNLNAWGGIPDSVRASKVRISGSFGNFHGLQLAVDGKIYATRAHGYPQTALSVINSPNSLGLSCNYVDSAIYLNGKIAYMGLPNFIDSYDYSNTTFDCSITGIDDEGLIDKVSAFPNPFTTQTTLQTDKVLKDATLTLYNSLGQQVRQVSNISGQTLTLQRDNLPSGLYYLQLTQDNQTIATDKLVIAD